MEAIVALLVLAAMGAAIILLMVQISALNNSAKLRNQASAYSDQGLEQVRGYNQTNGWVSLSGKGTGAGRCYSDGTLATTTVCIPTGLANTTCNTGAGAAILNPTYLASYTRSIKITSVGDQVAVLSTVCWLEKTIWNKVETTTYFYNY